MKWGQDLFDARENPFHQHWKSAQLFDSFASCLILGASFYLSPGLPRSNHNNNYFHSRRERERETKCDYYYMCRCPRASIIKKTSELVFINLRRRQRWKMKDEESSLCWMQNMSTMANNGRREYCCLATGLIEMTSPMDASCWTLLCREGESHKQLCLAPPAAHHGQLCSRKKEEKKTVKKEDNLKMKGERQKGRRWYPPIGRITEKKHGASATGEG